MTLIDFYVLQKESGEAQQHFACRLIEKAVKQGNKVMVATNDEAETIAMDKALWSFRPDAFIPHTILGENDVEDSPVTISHSADNPKHHDVLVNLRLNVPSQFSRFHRLAEIVTQNKTVLENSRKSYAYYKTRGYPINTHKIT